MPPKRRPADDPVEWLNRARSNLARAKADIRIPHVYLEDLSLTHSRRQKRRSRPCYLTFECGSLTITTSRSCSTLDASRLTRFAVVTRYPGIAEPITRQDYKRAVTIAEKVLRWAETLIAKKP